MIDVVAWNFKGASYRRTSTAHKWTVAFDAGLPEGQEQPPHQSGVRADCTEATLDGMLCDAVLHVDYMKGRAKLKLTVEYEDEDSCTSAYEEATDWLHKVVVSNLRGLECQPELQWNNQGGASHG